MDFRQKLETVAVGAIVIVGAIVLFLWWAYITVIVIVVGSIVTLIGGIAIAHWVQPLFDKRHNRRLERERLEHEKAMDEQRLQMECDRFAMEQARHTQELALLERKSWLEEHLALTRIPTNIYMHTPDGFQYLPDHRALRPALPRAKVTPEQEEEEEQNETPVPALPAYVRYDDIRSQVPRGHVLVGIGQTGLETKEWAIGACVWIVGLSGTGKTSTTVTRVEERRAVGHTFFGVDPHFFKPDSLTNALAPYARNFLMPMAKTPEQINEVLNAFLAEFLARKGGRVPQPWQKITLLVDEVNAIMDPTDKQEEENAKLLPTIARICGQEARNFNMGGIFISQQATGLAWLRKVALMVIVHQLLQESEKKLATNNDAAAMLDMKTWPIGRTYVYGVGFGKEGPRTVQQPYFEPARVVDADPVSAGAQNISFLRSVPQKKDDECFEDDGIEPLPMRTEQVPSEALGTTMSTGAPEQVPAKSTDEKQFTPEQEREFLRLYGIHKSIRKAILSMGISYGRYQKCASQLVERKLRKA